MFLFVGRRQGPSAVDLKCMPLGNSRCMSVGGRRPPLGNAVSCGNFKVSSNRLKVLGGPRPPERSSRLGGFLSAGQGRDLYGRSSFGLRGSLGSPSGGHRPTGPSIVAGSRWAAEGRPLAMQFQVAIRGVYSNRLRRWCAAEGRWKFASFRW